MQQYELMLVFRPDIDLKDEKAASDVVAKLIGNAAAIQSTTLLGKKQLAYPIKKRTEGVYVLCKLGGNIKTSDIEKQVRMGAEVLRYLLIANA